MDGYRMQPDIKEESHPFQAEKRSSVFDDRYDRSQIHIHFLIS